MVCPLLALSNDVIHSFTVFLSVFFLIPTPFISTGPLSIIISVAFRLILFLAMPWVAKLGCWLISFYFRGLKTRSCHVNLTRTFSMDQIDLEPEMVLLPLLLYCWITAVRLDTWLLPHFFKNINLYSYKFCISLPLLHFIGPGICVFSFIHLFFASCLVISL